MRQSKVTWTTTQIDEAKQRVRRELEAAMERGGAKGRLDAILSGIKTQEDAVSPERQLQLYVYVMSALVHHERYGGLPPQQIPRLVNIAYAVLKFQGIQAETSKMAFLYGELHLALSQIHRKNGEHWSASWEQQMAYHLARRRPPGDEAFQNLAIAIRALRLAHGERALDHYQRAEANLAAGSQFEKARVGRVRSLRLIGHHDKARELARETMASPDISRRTHTELEWEAICIEASTTGGLWRMMSAVQRNGSHYDAVYIAEAFLWASAVREREFADRLPKMQTLARKKDLNVRELGFFLRAVLQIESCYDSATPFVLRLKTLGSMLGQMNELVSIDRELLFQAAAARWLSRNRAAHLAAATLCEYQGSSLKLTLGRSSDALGVVGDLLDRAWFASAEADSKAADTEVDGDGIDEGA